MIENLLPYVTVFASSLVLTLILTPLVREVNRRLGMVDQPDPRRINTVPIPRGGGMAVLVGILVPYFIFHLVSGRPWVQGLTNGQSYRMIVLMVAIALLGLADDRYSLKPKVKFAGQLVIASLVWWWIDLGFADIWPSMPVWLDGVVTVFWIVGAVNAFNLIDGLDGLAAGLALIATLGMAGSLFFANNPQAALFYFAIAGALLGFLRYNYNPASVFLGDSGSMLLGFLLSTLPMASHAHDSFMVSVGVPLLAMGVPIFDTALAILRRSIRRQLASGNHSSGKVMSADSDHLHHRILRATGLNQRKTAWILYGIAAAAVGVGLVAMLLKSRAAGLWLAAISVASVVIFRDASIELFDAGRLLGKLAHSHEHDVRRRFASFAVPFFVVSDIIAIVAVFLLCLWSSSRTLNLRVIQTELTVRVTSVFVMLVFFRAYQTVWSRALLSNYLRLLMACVFGSVASSVFLYYWPTTILNDIRLVTLSFACGSFVALTLVRVTRGLVRDLFYAVDCSRLKNRKDVSRILVYGAGLRYQAFRRELVRTTSANDRIIVGLIDDDIFLKGHYIGGIRILGTINDVREIINATNADALVIACQLSDAWLNVVKEHLRPTGIKVSMFTLSEKPVQLAPEGKPSR